jgi:beta-hydroxyacyl-ACP dehydratase FabZ
MDLVEIQELIPHRYPFLLIDRVHELVPNRFIRAIKNISATDPFLQGHFPGNPVMPGVLILESLAQASAILGKRSGNDDCSQCLLTEVVESRFRRIVMPGDCLNLEVRLVKARKSFFWFEGEATVEGELAAAAKFTAKLA